MIFLPSGRMLVQDRDAQYYEPPLVQTEGPNAKKKKQERSIRLRPNCRSIKTSLEIVLPSP